MRTLIIHNVTSGFGTDAIYEFERALLRQGDECVTRIILADADNSGILADAESFDLVVISGGDGTVTSMLYELRDRGVRTCVFPSGTANLFFANLGNAAEPAALARSCRMGGSLNTDLGEVMWLGADGRRLRTGFGIMAGLGFDAAIMQTAMAQKKSLGQAAYFTAALSNIHPSVQRFTITVDGITYERTGISCIVANNATIQGDLEIVPDCTMTDGMLDVIMIETDDAIQLLKPLVFGLVDREGKKIGRPRLESFRGREVRVETSEPLAMQVDGDVVSESVSAYIARTLPAANLQVVDGLGKYRPDPDAKVRGFGQTDQAPYPLA